MLVIIFWFFEEKKYMHIEYYVSTLFLISATQNRFRK